ncbi:hypothetical protein [Pseudomonas phage KP1]|uniref:Scaffold protein n=1 Tax=Pseudomonas phage KP1 TaxID=2562463 RepID=A0A6G5QAH5_9CAUD|nr:head scaffolding protein [Pseudomonas phage KP1]QBZ71724.1 hypothetical protein [Pseudomonas phage KP1]
MKMALKKKLTKEEHAKLSDVIKAEYVEDGDGFRLDVEGEEDTGALKRSKDREKQLRQEAERKLQEAQEQLDALGTDDARKKGDIATLEKSWQKKLEDQRTEYETKVQKLTGHTTKSLVDNVATQLATELFKSPALGLPHIRSRLQADFEGDEPRTRILDKDGKPSAMTVAELKAEFLANKDFAPILVASKASGGAGNPSTKPGVSDPNFTQTEKPADLSRMNAVQLAEHLKGVKAAAESTE